MLVELKNGETLNGHLVLCDTWMNLTLREVVQTSPVGSPSSTDTPFANAIKTLFGEGDGTSWLTGWMA